MPAGTGTLGRSLILKWNGAKIGGAREKSVALNGEPIDVSDDDASGWRELLEEDGSKMVDISLSGVTKSAVLRAARFGTTIGALTLEYPNGEIVSGDFKLVTYSETGPYNEAVTFEASFQSTGAVTRIAGN